MDTDPQTQPGGLLHAGDPGAAIMLLTRLPVPSAWVAHRGAAAAWAWPLVGALVASLGWLCGTLALAAGLPAGIAAAFALGAMIVATGAMHEDGLADCADGFWGGRERERRLEIMRDSRIGAYGVVSLILVLGLRWIALATLFDAHAAFVAILVSAMASRASMAVVMGILPFAREDGLALLVGRPAPATFGLGAGIVAGAAVVSAGWTGALALVAAALAALAVTTAARRAIGGQTGDVLGAAEQLSGTAALLAFVAALP